MAPIRMNPIMNARMGVGKAPAPMGGGMPRAPTMILKPRAPAAPKMPGMGGSAAAGGMFSHLGHFGNPAVMAAGHNTTPHPGFKAVAAKIGKKKGIRDPGAVLAASSRNASAKAKRRNPRLKRVKG